MMTTYCTHRYRPAWRVDYDGVGQLVCQACGNALTPRPTRDFTRSELFVLTCCLTGALIGFGAWFWWTWLA